MRLNALAFIKTDGYLFRVALVFLRPITSVGSGEASSTILEILGTRADLILTLAFLRAETNQETSDSFKGIIAICKASFASLLLPVIHLGKSLKIFLPSVHGSFVKVNV